MKREEEVIIENALLNELAQGHISRRQFMIMSIMAGLGMAGVGALGAPTRTVRAAQDSRPLTPTFYQWIIDLHPGIPDVNKAFGDLNFQIAPVAGFDVARFVAEGKNKQSTWDVYVGMTPFVEMAALIKAD